MSPLIETGAKTGLWLNVDTFVHTEAICGGEASAVDNSHNSSGCINGGVGGIRVSDTGARPDIIHCNLSGQVRSKSFSNQKLAANCVGGSSQGALDESRSATHIHDRETGVVVVHALTI